ncbi:MAG TPA: hypothetical protein GX714_07770 [Chloroflexi bacterium]|nr:hypothetical protein [Chloroflexota bacterium]
MAEVQRVFTVDGKPFFSIGGQARNSSGYNAAEAETAFQAVKLLHGNTLEIPVYWEQVEPEVGRFDFSSVGELLSSARRHGVKLVLLWFATWKNGDMDYALPGSRPTPRASSGSWRPPACPCGCSRPTARRRGRRTTAPLSRCAST